MNPITATKDPTQTTNPFYGGTINIGGTPTVATPITPALKAFNQEMVKGNTSPTVVSNYNTPSKVNEIVTKSETLTGTPLRTPIKQAIPQTTPTIQETQIKDYTNAPYQTRDGQNYFFNEQTKAYDIPDVGESTGLLAQDPYSLAIAKNIQDARKKNDAALASALEGIKNRFEGYRETQRKVTESGAAAARNALLQTEGNRGSVAQFAAATSEGRVNAIMEEGNQALKDLDNKERELVIATQSAYATENFKLLDKLNSQIETLRQEKLQKTQAINEQLAKEEVLARENKRQGDRDFLISELYSQGITDPASILKQARENGYDFTLKEVSDSIKSLVPEGLDDLVKTLRVNGAPEETVVKVLNSSTLGEAYKNAGAYASGGTGMVGEYNFYRAQELAAGRTPVSFDTYQNVDANRKKSIARAGGTTIVSGGGAVGGRGYKSDLDALVGITKSTIPTKFGQETFVEQINQARSKEDKIRLVSAQILRNSPSVIQTDFIAQRTAMKDLDRAIQMLDNDVKTGLVEASKQYAYNVVGQEFDPKLAKVNALITAAIQPYRNSITGAAWGTQEDQEYQQLFGSTKYSPKDLKARLQTVKEILENKTIQALNSQVDPMGTGNFFEDTTTQVQKLGADAKQSVIDYGTNNPQARKQIEQMVGDGMDYYQIKQILGI